MRVCRIFVAAVTAAVLSVASPATAGHRESTTTPVEFHTPLPCGPACPGFLFELTGEGHACACDKAPMAAPGTFDDIRVTVPDRIETLPPRMMFFTIYPRPEHDGYVCRVVDPGLPTERYVPPSCPEQCVFVTTLCSSPFECPQTSGYIVAPGEVYVLRVYNELGEPVCRGDYTFLA